MPSTPCRSTRGEASVEVIASRPITASARAMMSTLIAALPSTSFTDSAGWPAMAAVEATASSGSDVTPPRRSMPRTARPRPVASAIASA